MSCLIYICGLLCTPLMAVSTCIAKVGEVFDADHKMGDPRCTSIVNMNHVFRTCMIVHARTMSNPQSSTCLRLGA
jgi:hypothetical protein